MIDACTVLDVCWLCRSADQALHVSDAVRGKEDILRLHSVDFSFFFMPITHHLASIKQFSTPSVLACSGRRRGRPDRWRAARQGGHRSAAQCFRGLVPSKPPGFRLFRSRRPLLAASRRDRRRPPAVRPCRRFCGRKRRNQRRCGGQGTAAVGGDRGAAGGAAGAAGGARWAARGGRLLHAGVCTSVL